MKQKLTYQNRMKQTNRRKRDQREGTEADIDRDPLVQTLRNSIKALNWKS